MTKPRNILGQFFKWGFKRQTPQSWLLYCLLESSHFILCVCLDETPLEPIWTFELCSGHFECFLFGTAVWLAETVIKIFGCQSKRNGLALWWAIIRKRSWREKKKTLKVRVWWKNILVLCTGYSLSDQLNICQLTSVSKKFVVNTVVIYCWVQYKFLWNRR